VGTSAGADLPRGPVTPKEDALLKLASRVAATAVLLVSVQGCASTLSPPFDAAKSANAQVTAFRLQNYEPPPQQQQAQPGIPGFQLPPQVQQWAQAAAQMLPPGLLQGIVPSGQQPAQQDVPRFHEFRILGYVPMSDPANRDAMLELFGTSKNFQQPTETCMFAEFGFSIPMQQGAPPADILVSLSCNQVRVFGFNWPHGTATALTPDASKKLIGIVKKSFGG
jgi:hypothetical protein